MQKASSNQKTRKVEAPQENHCGAFILYFVTAAYRRRRLFCVLLAQAWMPE